MKRIDMPLDRLLDCTTLAVRRLRVSAMVVDLRAANLAGMPGFGTDPASVRLRIAALERLLEGLFVIPGTSRRIGLDSVIGLVPVVGDVFTGAMGAYLVWEARNLGMSKWTLARMTANVGVDTALGAIPFVGDIFDFVFKSNSKNLRMIKRHLDRHHPAGAVVDAKPL